MKKLIFVQNIAQKKMCTPGEGDQL